MNLGQQFVKYYEEERGENIIHTDKGFISWKHYPDSKEIMVTDFFVVPEYRGTPTAFRLAEKVKEKGKELGCTHMSCWIHFPDRLPQTLKRKSHVLRTNLRYGFEIYSQDANQIVLIKEIEQGEK